MKYDRSYLKNDAVEATHSRNLVWIVDRKKMEKRTRLAHEASGLVPAGNFLDCAESPAFSDRLRQPDDLLDNIPTSGRFLALRPYLTVGLPLSCAIVNCEISTVPSGPVPRRNHFVDSAAICQ